MPESKILKNRAFRVDIPDEELSFEVRPEQSLVEAAAEHDIEILTACEDGKSGTCVVKVLEGAPEHRDQTLSAEKRGEGWMCACVSRAQSDYLCLEIW